MKATEIINGLGTIATQFNYIAIIWHILFYILIISLLANWQPSNRLIVILIALPLVSVAVLAWIYGNPFNGITFSIVALLLLFFALKTSSDFISTSQPLYVVIGIMMIIFGLIYPHFVEPNSLFKYLYASPFGLVPCPTLSVLIGFALVFNGFNSQAINLVLIIFGLFYGLFGAFKLGVYLDLGLIFGTGTLLVKYILAFR